MTTALVLLIWHGLAGYGLGKKTPQCSWVNASQNAILGPRNRSTQEFSHASRYTSTEGKLCSTISHVSGPRAALKISALSS